MKQELTRKPLPKILLFQGLMAKFDVQNEQVKEAHREEKRFHIAKKRAGIPIHRYDMLPSSPNKEKGEKRKP